MGLIRLLLYGALIWLLVRLVKGVLAPRSGTGGGAAGPATGELRGGELVQDPQCGVYIPKDTAVHGPGGSYFCSSECRDAHARKDS